ncbi:MAG: hypothetical protein WC378_01360 [Opitutaceae bacterium]|jgi:hypothetical protein
MEAVNLNYVAGAAILLVAEFTRELRQDCAHGRVVDDGREFCGESGNAARKVFETEVQVVGILGLRPLKDRVGLHDDKRDDACHTDVGRADRLEGVVGERKFRARGGKRGQGGIGERRSMMLWTCKKI